MLVFDRCREPGVNLKHIMRCLSVYSVHWRCFALTWISRSSFASESTLAELTELSGTLNSRFIWRTAQPRPWALISIWRVFAGKCLSWSLISSRSIANFAWFLSWFSSLITRPLSSVRNASVMEKTEVMSEEVTRLRLCQQKSCVLESIYGSISNIRSQMEVERNELLLSSIL